MIPKRNKDSLDLREQLYGDPRRNNMPRLILDHKPNFPLGVELKDIDKAFIEWAEEKLYVTYEETELPTYKLFSNQRINEYAQSWKYLDENGNLLLNFKTITRENNPKHGENQGSWYNIPGDRKYPLYMIPVTEESGEHYYEMYSMKQPFACDMNYTLSIITNHYELLNTFNEMVLNEFKALECYIAPNGHHMPMTLSDVSDSSEYAIDNRKFYSQDFNIKIKAYIIREEDFEVTQIPTKVRISGLGMSNKTHKKAYVEEEDIDETCPLREKEDPIYSKMLTYHIEGEVTFIMDTNFLLKEMTMNGNNPTITINGEKFDCDKHWRWYENDKISFEGDFNDKGIVIRGFDENSL